MATICSEMAFRSWIKSRTPTDKVNSWKSLQGRWGNVKGNLILFSSCFDILILWHWVSSLCSIWIVVVFYGLKGWKQQLEIMKIYSFLQNIKISLSSFCISIVALHILLCWKLSTGVISWSKYPSFGGWPTFSI